MTMQTTCTKFLHYSLALLLFFVQMTAAPLAEAGVDLSTGAFNDNYRFVVPPGSAGLAPNAFMTYSSQSGGDGTSGIGWSLPIGSVVDYPGTGPVLAIPGVARGKLVTQGSSIKTERESFTRIERSALLDPFGAPCFYIVTDKRGTRYVLGGSPLDPGNAGASRRKPKPARPCTMARAVTSRTKRPD